jgi:hypothetical protein
MKMSDKRNASQRIEDLERALMSLFQTCDNMARDLTLVKDAVKILGNKVDAIAKAAGISDDTISAIMVENNVAELKGKVDTLVSSGVLVLTDTAGDSSFLVGSEINEEGTVVNPRLQFALSALQGELQEKLKGSKAGDVITLQEGKLKFQVQEVYNIQTPTTSEEAPAETTTETTSEGEEVAGDQAANS